MASRTNKKMPRLRIDAGPRPTSMVRRSMEMSIGVPPEIRLPGGEDMSGSLPSGLSYSIYRSKTGPPSLFTGRRSVS